MNAIETSSDILKNAILDSTEAYLEARLATADFVKTQIGVIINYVQGQYTLVVPTGNENPSEKEWYEYNKSTHTYSLSLDTYVHRNKNYYNYQNDKKYYHDVSCDNGRVIYNNVLSIGNTPFPAESVVFLISPNAQFSNQFILGKLDSTPINIEGGSINIGDGNFVVTDQGVMTAKQGTFEGTITGGSININDKFIVDNEGNMEATTGTIGNFTLGDGAMYAYGIINFRTDNTVSTSSESPVWKDLSSFVPSELGILSNFQINFEYEVLSSSSRPMFIQLQRYNYDGSWSNITTQSLNRTVGAEEVVIFDTVFSNTDTRTYRLYFTMNSAQSTSQYQQSIKYSIYTNTVISTALTANGYNGKINSASGTIGGVDYGGGRLSSLGNSYSGFEIDSDSLEIRSDTESILSEFGDTYFMFSKSYNWASGADYPVMGLFVRTDDSVNYTTLTLYKDSNNLLNLLNDGSYYYYTNGTLHSGTLDGGSDRRIKEDITPLDNQLSKKLIDGTNVYKFKYKNNDGYHYGVIAQEVRETLDELKEDNVLLEYSIGDTNIKDQRSVRYQEFIAPIIVYIKDLQRQINELKKEDK